jgi:hypothetical protein
MFDKSNREHQIFALHRYYCWTTLMKRDFENALLSGKHLPAAGESPLLWPVKYMSGEVGMYMSYWYGGLFVVCEGWQELGLSDAKVDPLLDSPNLDLLKRYRHGAFHFQKDYFDGRFLQFEAEQNSAKWVHDLSEALGDWFLEWLQERKTPSNPSEPSAPPKA